MRRVKTLHFYWAVVGLCLVLLAWWMVYFARQGDILVRRVAAAGIELTPEQAQAIREAAHTSLRMLVFEGSFLALMLLASVYLVVRASRREVAVHRQQRSFLSAVTHELKSPIASAQLYVESMLLGRAEGEKRERYLAHTREDLKRMQETVEALLESARLASTGPDLRLRTVDLAAESERILATLSEERVTEGAEVELAAPGEVAVKADPAAIEMIVRNLVANAVKYGGDHPRVRVAVTREGKRGRLEVRDWGPGLNGITRRKIFDAFARGGDENVRTQKGVGLGLFLVSELTRAMGGSVRALDDLADGGLSIQVSLPGAANGAAA